MEGKIETPAQDKELNPIFGFIILGLFLILIFKLFDWGFLKGEITEYPVQCEHVVSLNQCKSPQFTLNKTTYKILSNRQEVIYWSEVTKTPDKLSNCAVINRKNWSCEYKDKSAKLGFTDGKYWSITNPEMATPVGLDYDSKIYYVSRFQWLNLKCHGSDEPYILCLPIVILFE